MNKLDAIRRKGDKLFLSTTRDVVTDIIIVMVLAAVMALPAIVLLLWTDGARAQTPNPDAPRAFLSWEAPTERVDGTPITPAEIDRYEVFFVVGDSPAGIGDTEAKAIVRNGTSEVIELNLPPRPTPYVVHFAVAAAAVGTERGPLSEAKTAAFMVRSTVPLAAPTKVEFEITCGAGRCAVEPVATD